MSDIIAATIVALFWNWVYGWGLSFHGGLALIGATAAATHLIDLWVKPRIQPVIDRVMGRMGA